MLFQLPTKKSFLLAVTLTSAGLTSRTADANPAYSLADEIEVIREVVDLFSSFCEGATGLCNDIAAGDALVRRELADDTAIANRHLEASVDKLRKNKLYQNKQRKLDGLDEDIFLCAIETIGCHLYLDNMFLPPIEEYTYVDVCIATDGFKNECEDVNNVKEIKFVDSTNDIKENEFLYQSQGPAQLQGVFALEYSDCAGSTLVSWAEGRESQGGLNTGVLGDVDGDGSNFGVTGPLRTPGATEYIYAQRALGDHSWVSWVLLNLNLRRSTLLTVMLLSNSLLR